ncbi:hypothetical protein Unana1_06699 [Umbelopsis nana]
MWRSIVYIATVLHFLISSTVANTITVPLYKRTVSPFYAANGNQLDDGLLAGEVSIGNPPQQMRLVFDTTSGYTWARGDKCKSENCLDRCTFYPTRSKSIRYTGLKHDVSYGDACVDTKVWQDTISFANVTVPHSYFGVANRMNGFDHGFGVTVGTAQLPAAPATGTQPPQTPAVVPANNTTTNPSTSPASTGFTKRGQQQSDAQPVGQLIFGGIDDSKIDGNIHYMRVSSPRKDEVKGWNICIREAKFGKKLKLHQYKYAIASISSSSPYITMPQSQADCFHDKFGAVYESSTGTYTIKCSDLNHLPPLTLEFDSITVELPTALWTGITDADRDCCHTKIRRGSSEHDWVLGTTFTHAFYSVFDSEKNAIGFALLKGGDNGVKIQVKN